MIDEFQDIDPPQYALMQVLCDYHKNLFIVGDPTRPSTHGAGPTCGIFWILTRSTPRRRPS